jgi:hypothetical protein
MLIKIYKRTVNVTLKLEKGNQFSIIQMIENCIEYLLKLLFHNFKRLHCQIKEDNAS